MADPPDGAFCRSRREVHRKPSVHSSRDWCTYENTLWQRRRWLGKQKRGGCRWLLAGGPKKKKIPKTGSYQKHSGEWWWQAFQNTQVIKNGKRCISDLLYFYTEHSGVNLFFFLFFFKEISITMFYFYLLGIYGPPKLWIFLSRKFKWRFAVALKFTKWLSSIKQKYTLCAYGTILSI